MSCHCLSSHDHDFFNWFLCCWWRSRSSLFEFFRQTRQKRDHSLMTPHSLTSNWSIAWFQGQKLSFLRCFTHINLFTSEILIPLLFQMLTWCILLSSSRGTSNCVWTDIVNDPANNLQWGSVRDLVTTTVCQSVLPKKFFYGQKICTLVLKVTSTT